MKLSSALTVSTLSAAAYLALAGVAWAGTIAAQGNVTALDHPNQIASVTGKALFDEMGQGDLPLDTYAGQGMTLWVDDLANILPGVTAAGATIQPIYAGQGTYFPRPIQNGGVVNNSIAVYAGAATFDSTVTQFGLVAGGSGTQYITVWDQMGALIGQVSWEPEDGDAGFMGIDTMGVPIGLLTYGNDDIFNGEAYDVQGPGTSSDTWMWGDGSPCVDETNCLDDEWSCTSRSCVDGACNYPPTEEPCDDGDACTENDTCSDYACAGSTVNCSDGIYCTFDQCHIKDGCFSEPIEGCCETDEDCPEGSMCVLSSNTCTEPPPPPPPPPPGDGDPDNEDTDTGDETTGAPPADEDGGGGCSCRSDERGGGALAGLLALFVLGTAGRRRSRQ